MQNWIPIISFPEINEANTAHDILKAAEINAVIEDKASMGTYLENPMNGFVRVFVPKDQVEAAVTLLKESGYTVGNTETEFEKKLGRFIEKISKKFSA